MADMFNIVSAWGAQTNPHYDPDTANNGGGYWQFLGGIVVALNGQLVTVEVDDTSCGDFGSRVYFSVTADGFFWHFSDGTMDDASIDTPEDVLGVLRSISGVLGVDAEALISAALNAANICAREACYAD
jgi:hypothetical protein